MEVYDFAGVPRDSPDPKDNDQYRSQVQAVVNVVDDTRFGHLLSEDRVVLVEFNRKAGAFWLKDTFSWPA